MPRDAWLPSEKTRGVRETGYRERAGAEWICEARNVSGNHRDM